MYYSIRMLLLNIGITWERKETRKRKIKEKSKGEIKEIKKEKLWKNNTNQSKSIREIFSLIFDIPTVWLFYIHECRNPSWTKLNCVCLFFSQWTERVFPNNFTIKISKFKSKWEYNHTGESVLTNTSWHSSVIGRYYIDMQ